MDKTFHLNFEKKTQSKIPLGVPGLRNCYGEEFERENYHKKTIGLTENLALFEQEKTDLITHRSQSDVLISARSDNRINFWKTTNDVTYIATPRQENRSVDVLLFCLAFEETLDFGSKQETISRQVKLLYDINKKAVEIREPKIENSGFVQGTFLKSTELCKLKLLLKDLLIGQTILLLGRKMLVLSCDSKTRNYFQEILQLKQPQDIKLIQPQTTEYEKGLSLSQEQKENNARHNRNFYGDFKKYLKYGEKKLTFFSCWDDDGSGNSIKEKRYFSICYYLCDDTIEIIEKHLPNSGRDTFSKFLSRCLPVKPVTDETKTSFYTWHDFRCGNTIELKRRSFQLLCCDVPTATFFSENGIEQVFDSSLTEFRKAISPNVPKSSRRSVSEREKAQHQRKAFRQLKEFGSHALKMRLKHTSGNKESYFLRNFVLAFFLADEKLAVFEPKNKTSHGGGKFLEKGRYINQETGKYFSKDDFIEILNKKPPMITIMKRKFEIVFVDIFTQDFLGISFTNPKGNARPGVKSLYLKLREHLLKNRQDFRKVFYKADKKPAGFITLTDCLQCFETLREQGLVVCPVESDAVRMKFSCHGRFYYKNFCRQATKFISDLSEKSKNKHFSSFTKLEDIERMINQKLQDEGKSLRILFRKFDTDKSGTLTFSEFRELLKHFNLELTLREVAQIMSRYDKDQEGTIDYTEFCDRIERLQHTRTDQEKSNFDVTESLNFSDFNLEPEKTNETKQYLNNVQKQEMQQNKLSYNENLLQRFVSLCSSRKVQLRQIFRQLDDSKDGKISKDEFQQALESFREFSKDDQQIILNHFYSNHQGSLEYDQFMHTIAILNA